MKQTGNNTPHQEQSSKHCKGDTRQPAEYLMEPPPHQIELSLCRKEGPIRWYFNLKKKTLANSNKHCGKLSNNKKQKKKEHVMQKIEPKSKKTSIYWVVAKWLLLNSKTLKSSQKEENRLGPKTVSFLVLSFSSSFPSHITWGIRFDQTRQSQRKPKKRKQL